MTSKEKAEDLVLKYSILKDGHNDLVKQCAMICVRELLKNDYNERSFVYEDKEGIHYTLYSVYWADVLIEISKL